MCECVCLRTYPSNGKHGVVRADFFCSAMTASTVCEKDNDACQEGYAGHGKNQLLWPGVCVGGPGGHLALIRQ